MFSSQPFIQASTVILFFFLSIRPDPPIPGQTNGIGSPEQLTGRFQVSGQARPVQTVFKHESRICFC